jgi:hypothetical protein
LRIAPLLHQTVKVKPYTSRDAYGDLSYGAERSYKARVEYYSAKRKDMFGFDVLIHAIVYLEGDVEVKIDDGIVLPDGSEYPAVTVHKGIDGTGNIHHTKVVV